MEDPAARGVLLLVARSPRGRRELCRPPQASGERLGGLWCFGWAGRGESGFGGGCRLAPTIGQTDRFVPWSADPSTGAFLGQISGQPGRRQTSSRVIPECSHGV